MYTKSVPPLDWRVPFPSIYNSTKTDRIIALFLKGVPVGLDTVMAWDPSIFAGTAITSGSEAFSKSSRQQKHLPKTWLIHCVHQEMV